MVLASAPKYGTLAPFPQPLMVPVPLRPSYYDPEDATNEREGGEGGEEPLFPGPGVVAEGEPALGDEDWYHADDEAGAAVGTPGAMGAVFMVDIAMGVRGGPDGLAAALEDEIAEVDGERRREGEDAEEESRF